MGHGLLHQSNTSRRIGAVLARSKDSHGLGEKVGVGAITLRGDARRDQADLLYLEIRRGTQVAQGRGLQNLHSWVRIPPAPPRCWGSGPDTWVTERTGYIGNTFGPKGLAR